MKKLLLLISLLWISPLGAQPESEEENAPATEETRQDEQAAQRPQTNNDPFDYEASEQISEDLSVSFPVDI